MQNRRKAILAAASIAVGLMAPEATLSQSSSGAETFDARSLAEWRRVGDANWAVDGDVVQASSGNGFLVSKDSYSNFKLRAEFWVDEKANSGIFIRCQDQQKPGTKTGYEVNIFDERPDPSYGTGAIVDVAKVAPMLKAGGKWNVMEITAQGSRFTIVLNGQVTVSMAEDARFPAGYIGLQYGAGLVKFRKIEITKI
jgi:hypothetical protein